ncbi:MAG: hypothetical protein AAFN93_17475 [Bacteroidota bacterium]
MESYEKKRLDRQFELFTKKNFEKPSKCKNLEEIRFYIQELSLEIEQMKKDFNYVPNAAYELLSQYNRLQNKLVFADFKNTY